MNRGHRGLRSPERGWMLVVPGIFMLAWGGNHFTPLLHVYQTLGGYVPWQANLLLGMYVFGIIPGMLVAASLSDRYGRKPVFLVGVAASLVGNLMIGVGLHAFALLCAGRVLAGVGVGIAMSVGTSWVKELSSPPFDLRSGPIAGARRPSLTLTLGFAIGAGVSGVLAQYAPMPELLPFVAHVVLDAVALPLAALAPETRGRRSRGNTGPAGPGGAAGAAGEPGATGPADPPAAGSAAARSPGSWWSGLRVPGLRKSGLAGIIVPAAPWVFAASGVAYAVVPSGASEQLGDLTTIFATVLTVLTMGTGAVAQALAPRIDRATGGRALQVSLVAMTAGMVLAAIATWVGSPVLALVVAVVLGAAYGLCVIAGLAYVQRMAPPDELAGLTGVYYSLSYLGFLLPTVLAALLPVAPYCVSLAVVALVCAGCLVTVHRRLRFGS